MNLKVDELKAEANILSPDIIAVTESWTNSTHTTAYLSFKDYSLVMRQDRQGKRGGGILLYAKTSLSNFIVPGLSEIGDGIFNQYISCKLLGKSSEINLYIIYRPPKNCDPDYISNNTKLCNLVQSIPEHSILCGDFNYSSIDWKSLSSDAFEQQFLDTCNDRFLS